MVHQLVRTQHLKCDLEVAWDFFSSPNNLSLITPKEMNFIVLSEETVDHIYEGMVIDYKVTPLPGIQMKWKTLITEVNDKKNFTDFQKKGPYKLWNHFHEFFPDKNGVLVKDTVDYELPFGFLGELVNRIIVRKKLEHIFNYRNEVLEKLFNAKK